MEGTQFLQCSSILKLNVPLETKNIAKKLNFCKNYIFRNTK